MREYVIKYVFIFVLFTLSNRALTIESGFLNYSTSEGLVHKSIYCMCRDSDGFLWIGTSNGLSRFDGYQFKNFSHDDEKKSSIKGLSIYAIVEGRNSKIWLSTDAGLECFDKKTESFDLIKIIEPKSYFDVNIDIDDSGNLWVYSYPLGFVVYNPSSKKVVAQYSLASMTSKTKDVNLNRYKIIKDQIVVSTSKGIYIYNIKSRNSRLMANTPSCFCRAIQKNGNNVIVTFPFDGIYIFNSITQKISSTSKAYIDNKIRNRTFFYDAVLTKDSTLWIGTTTGTVSLKNDNATYYNHTSRSNYFDGDVVSCMHIDREDNIWFGTYSNGILFKKKEKNIIRLASKLNKDDVDKSIVSYACTFDDGSLIYTDNRYVYRCKDYKKMTPNCSEKFYYEANTTIHPIDGRYCFINSIDTLFIYDSKKGTLNRLLFNRSTSSACLGKNGIVWVSTWMGTIYGFDMKGKLKFTYYADKIKKSWMQIYTIVADSDGSLWLGTFGQGLIHIIHPETGNPDIVFYKKKESDHTTIQSDIVHSIWIQGDKVWVATNGGGLNVLDKKSGKFTSYTKKDGLKSNIIESVVSDKKGNIWFASTVISKFDPIKKTFSHYSKADGVIGNLSAKGGSVTKDGYIIFPGTEGIYVIDPQNIPKKRLAITPFLTELKIGGLPVSIGDTINGEVPYKASVSYSDSLLLTYNNNSFSLQFASLQFQESQVLTYAYKLSNIDRDWIITDYKNRTASYSGLQPGKYLFTVKATNDGCNWSKERNIVIIISPPWWKTWKFNTLMILLCVLSVWIYTRKKLKSIKEQNLYLEKRVKERTEELIVINEQLKEQQKFVELKNQQLNDILNSKDELISILGHDFQNPLTGLLGAATMLKSESQKTKIEKIKDYSELILSSTKSLIAQMTMVLDWAQGHNQSLEATPIEINIEMLLDDTIALVAETAELKEIKITTQTDYQTNAFVDPRMISTVFRNLLINAIKFTPKGGSIIIMIHEFEKIIDITFIDTGIGIEKQKQTKLFFGNNNSHRTFGTDNEKGTGLGLQICKTFVEKNNGKIGFSSEPGKGSVFTVTIPKGKQPAVNPTTKISNDIEPIISKSTIGGTILIIEDNKEVSETIQIILGSDFNCIKSQNGEDGLFLAQKSLPDIIISDVNLPGISGLEICKILKKDTITSHIPILIISSHTSKEIENESYINGANDFISKPFDPTALKMKIQGLLEYRKKISDQIAISGTSAYKDSEMPADYDTKIIKKVLEFIHDNISDTTLDTEMVAEKTGISRTQLWRIFKNSTGKTLGDVIREIRMQKASEMIKTGKYRISEIAYEVGFSDPKYFSKCFVKEFGTTPTNYTENFKKS